MKKCLRFLPALFLLFSAPYLTAQQGSSAVIEYIEGDPFEVTVTYPSGEIEEGYIGQDIELGTTIQTGDGQCGNTA